MYKPHSKGIRLIKGDSFNLEVYDDYDLGKCQTDRRWVTCLCVFLINSLISSKRAQKQVIVSKSSLLKHNIDMIVATCKIL